MDADAIQREARASMTLPPAEVNAINLRLLRHMQQRNFNVSMLRLLWRPRTDEWVAVPNIHTFYDAFRHVLRFREKTINDASLSMAVGASRDWHLYVMGMLAYFKQHNFTWIVTRARLVLTPYAPGESAKSVAEAGLFARMFDPASDPPTPTHDGKVQVRKCDVEAIEFLIRVDLGLSHLQALSSLVGVPEAPPTPRNSSSDSSDSDSDSDSSDLPYTTGHASEPSHALARARVKSMPSLPSMRSPRSFELPSIPEAGIVSPRDAMSPRATDHKRVASNPSPRRPMLPFVQVLHTGGAASEAGIKKMRNEPLEKDKQKKGKKSVKNLEYRAIVNTYRKTKE